MGSPVNTMPDVLIITVNYKGADSTERFLASAARLQHHSEARIVVVENGSEDGSAERLRAVARHFDNVELLESRLNRGYFGAANWALQQFLSRGPAADWTIVCNNDITFEDDQFLVKLFARNPQTGQVLAPAIIARQTACDCNPFLRERPSRAQLLRYRFWLSHYPLMWFKQLLSPYVRIARRRLAALRSAAPGNSPAQIYAAHGAFLIFSRGYFQADGYIDDGFFLYAEEFVVAEICRRLSVPVIHDPALRVFHDAHRVTGRLCTRTSFQQGRDGLEYALRTYFFVPGASGSPQLRS